MEGTAEVTEVFDCIRARIEGTDEIFGGDKFWSGKGKIGSGRKAVGALVTWTRPPSGV
jgi:hypothetical protein